MQQTEQVKRQVTTKEKSQQTPELVKIISATTTTIIKSPYPSWTVSCELLQSNAAFKCCQKYQNHDMWFQNSAVWACGDLKAACFGFFFFCKRLMGNVALRRTNTATATECHPSVHLYWQILPKEKPKTWRKCWRTEKNEKENHNRPLATAPRSHWELIQFFFFSIFPWNTTCILFHSRKTAVPHKHVCTHFFFFFEQEYTHKLIFKLVNEF